MASFSAQGTAISTRIPKTVWVLGLVSLLMDISSEMVQTLLPFYLVSGLGASAVMVGFIEGLSDQEPKGIVSISDNLDASRAEGTELDYFHGAVTRAATPEDMDELVVPAGTWAVFENSGPFPQALQHLWRDVFTQWFPSNPYRSRPGPEILRTRLSPDAARADAELWIPVERTSL